MFAYNSPLGEVRVVPRNSEVVLVGNARQQGLRAVGRVLVAVLLGFVVLNVLAIAVMKSDFLPAAIQSQPWSEGALNHTAMWLVSLILILVIAKGKPSAYGFRLGKDYRWAPMVVAGFATGGVFAVILGLLPEGDSALLPDYTFAQTVIFVWLYASICEEILTRGLIQGFLAPLTAHGISICKLRISLPVLVGALFFGLMHLGLLTTGAALLPVLVLVAFATVLGIVAGYHREQTGSLIPAIIVHMLGNVGGYCTGLLFG